MKRHTLFLLQGKELQQGTVDRLIRWSADGLLHTVSFVELDSLPTSDPGTGEAPGLTNVQHFVMDRGEVAGPHSLLDWLADNYCDVLQLVALHTAAEVGEERDGVDAAERLRSELDHWLGDRQRVVAIACFLVDPSHATCHPSSVLPTWSANLVISPTDQALPAGTATPVRLRQPDGSLNPTFADIAAQNLCTLGGAWRFLEVGPLDHVRPSSATSGVQVVRAFVRTLDLADPTETVIQQALGQSTDARNPGWPLPASATSLVPAMPPELFATNAAGQLGERHSSFVDLSHHTPKPPRPRTALSLLEALRMFFGFLIRRARQAPGKAIDLAVVKASTAASTTLTKAIFGESSEYEIKVGRPRLRPIANTEALHEAVGRAAQMADPAAVFMPPNTKELWQEYLRVGISLVDGGALPPAQSAPKVGDARAVLTDPADVVVSPHHEKLVIAKPAIPRSEPVELSADDPLAVLQFRNQLSVVIESQGESASSERAPTGSVPTGADFVTPVPDVVIPAPPGEEPPSPPTDGAPQGSGIQAQLEEVDRWIASTRTPYTWQLGWRIGTALDSAEQEMLAAAQQLEAPLPSPPSGEVRPNRVFVPIGLGGLALVASIILWVLDRWTLRTALVVGLFALLVGFAIGFIAFTRDQRREFRLRFEYDGELERRSEAAEKFRHYTHETLRLSSVYWQYRQWTPILASLLHDPFVGHPAAVSPTEATVITDSSRATRSGTAQPDPGRLERLTHDARRRIFGTSWAQRAWEEAYVDLTREFAERHALTEVPDPFEENIRRRSGLLEHLTRAFSRGDHGEACRAGPRRTARDLVASSPLGSLTSAVLIDGEHRYPDAAAPSGADPVEGLFQEVLPAEGERRFAVALWRSKGLRSSVEVFERIVAVPPGWRERVPEGGRYHDTEPVYRNGQLLFAAARVDLSEPCHPEELIVFDGSSGSIPAASAAFYQADDGGD